MLYYMKIPLMYVAQVSERERFILHSTLMDRLFENLDTQQVNQSGLLIHQQKLEVKIALTCVQQIASPYVTQLTQYKC